MTLYARAITLRNCGRFTVIASDFGADYRTHTHVTCEALYAGLTHGVTWRAGGLVDGQTVYPLIQVKADRYDFAADYDLPALPIWFTPGLFGQAGNTHMMDNDLDAGYFNVVQELYPTTSGKFGFKKDELTRSDRPAHVPTYGTWQGILPNRQFHTFALANNPTFLERFEPGQTFLLGKKRTMIQVVEVSEIVTGTAAIGVCQTGYLQLQPNEISHFTAFEVLMGTIRYLIARGETQGDTRYFEFGLSVPGLEIPLALPEFYLKKTPLSLS